MQDIVSWTTAGRAMLAEESGSHLEPITDATPELRAKIVAGIAKLAPKANPEMLAACLEDPELVYHREALEACR